MASSDRFYMPFQTAWDGAGLVEAGAKLYFYVTGTTTPKDTYSNSGLSVANANPVVANSAGRFGAIFLGSGDYKVVLKDSDDVEIWSADPVSKATTTSATTAVAGIVELATTSEGLVGTDTARVPPVSVAAQMIIQGFSYGNNAGGTANALTSTPSITPTALAAGMKVYVRATATNTGATTLDYAGLGAVAVKVPGASGPTACNGGEIISGNTYSFTYIAADSTWLVQPVGENFAGIHAYTEDTTPDGTADFWLMYDVSAKLPKKVKPSSFGATAAQQETPTGTGVYVTPSIQQRHPSAIKAAVSIDGTGTVAINASYNVTSITDNGTGDYTANLTTAFSAATFVTNVNRDHNISVGQIAGLLAKATTSQRVGTGQTNGGTATDADPTDVIMVGDQ